MNITDVKPYEKNAKEHPDEQLRELARMVKEVGWRQSITVNQQSVIINGHGRFAAWLKYKDEYGLKPIWIMDDMGRTVYGAPENTPMTEAQERAYRIADNKLNESAWKYEYVKEELLDLHLNG